MPLRSSATRINRYRKPARTLCILALAVCAASSYAHATYTPPPPCNNPFTPQQEVTEGAKVAAKVYQQMPVLPESDWTAPLN